MCSPKIPHANGGEFVSIFPLEYMAVMRAEGDLLSASHELNSPLVHAVHQLAGKFSGMLAGGAKVRGIKRGNVITIARPGEGVDVGSGHDQELPPIEV